MNGPWTAGWSVEWTREVTCSFLTPLEQIFLLFSSSSDLICTTCRTEGVESLDLHRATSPTSHVALLPAPTAASLLPPVSVGTLSHLPVLL